MRSPCGSTWMEARTWLVVAHRDVERARDHIDECNRRLDEHDSGRSRGEAPEPADKILRKKVGSEAEDE
jgi:hypothetical protein